MTTKKDLTTVIHIRDAPANWRNDPEYVYIGRGSKWGNPFRITGTCDRRQSVFLYEERLLSSKHLLNSLHELQGKTLVCFCKPLECHGDVLARFANDQIIGHSEFYTDQQTGFLCVKPITNTGIRLMWEVIIDDYTGDFHDGDEEPFESRYYPVWQTGHSVLYAQNGMIATLACKCK